MEILQWLGSQSVKYRTNEDDISVGFVANIITFFCSQRFKALPKSATAQSIWWKSGLGDGETLRSQRCFGSSRKLCKKTQLLLLLLICVLGKNSD